MGTCTNTKQYRKRIRQFKEAKLRAFGPEDPHLLRKAMSAPLLPDGKWQVDESPWPDMLPGTKTKAEGWDFVSPPLKSEKELKNERVEINLVGWPWKGVPKRLITIAPYAFNSHASGVLAKRRNAQCGSALIQLFQNSIIREQISDLLFQYHDMAWKFAATCQEATALLGLTLNFWDISSGWFNNCEKPCILPGQGTKQSTPEQAGSVASVVIVTQIRRPQAPPSYAEQLKHLHTMCVSISNFSDYLRNIQFHRVPFLTTQVLSLLVPKMRNLKVLGVYKCQLIHVGDGLRLLEIICTDRPLGKEYQVSLDFFPNYHAGPIIEPGSEFTVGSYGVTWDNWNGDTGLATWAIAYRVITRAKMQGIDMASPHTSFRKFLEMSPCYDVDNTLAAMVVAFSIDQIEPGQSEFTPRPAPTHREDGTPIDPWDYELLWPDLIKAAALIDQRNALHEGKVHKFVAKNNKFRPEGYEWSIMPYPCAGCTVEMLGIFFHYKDIQNYRIEILTSTPPSPILCMGCRLSHYLDTEQDHYKSAKRSIIKRWLCSGDGTGWNDANLPKALQDYTLRRIQKCAERLDRMRMDQIAEEGFDRETQERQKPIPMVTRKANRGGFLRSPEVWEKKQREERNRAVAEDPQQREWRWFAESRYAGHDKYQG